MNNQKTVNQKTEKTENQKTKIINTNELTEIINQLLDSNFTPKKVRSHLRNDIVLSEIFDDSVYTRYQFSYPDKLTDYIIDRFREIQKEKQQRIINAKKRKAEKKEKQKTILRLNETTGKIEKVTIK